MRRGLAAAAVRSATLLGADVCSAVEERRQLHLCWLPMALAVRERHIELA